MGAWEAKAAENKKPQTKQNETTQKKIFTGESRQDSPEDKGVGQWDKKMTKKKFTKQWLQQ